MSPRHLDDDNDLNFTDFLSQYIQGIPSKLSRRAGKIYEGLWRGIKSLPHKLEETFSFPNTWNNLFPSFLMGYISVFRQLLTTPLFPDYTILPKEPKDAFWVLNRIVTTLKVDVFFSKLKDGWNWFASLNAVATVINGLSIAFKWLAPVLPYIPFVSLGISVCVSAKDFLYSENKNIASTLKFLANIAGTVLLGVGLGLIKWGGVAAALYNAPILIITAAAVVATVGLVKMAYHFYLAYKNPKKRKEHLLNGLKEMLISLINVTAIVLTLFGMQIGQHIANGFAQTDFSLFTQAGEIYQSAAVATNVVLAAVAALVVLKLCPKIYARYKKIRDKCFGTNVEMPVAVETDENELNKTKDDVETNIVRLNSEVNQQGISARLKAARRQKLDVLTVAQKVLKGEANSDQLLEAVTTAKKAAPATFGLYQSSFWKVKSNTQELVEKTLELSKSSIRSAG